MAGRRATPTGRYGGRSAAERRAERRRRFLDAGLELFGRGAGYRATTVAGLSEAAGLSTRQFYEEFNSLEDLLADLHLEVNDTAEQAVVTTLPDVAGLPLAERTARLFRAYAASITADRARIRIAFVEVIGVSPRMDRQRLARRARWIEFICAEAAAAAERGEIAARDYRIAAAAFTGSITGLLHDWDAGWVEASLDDLIDELVLLLLGRLHAADGGPRLTGRDG
ncbi:TetR/AcrR family transcriptional regulator [Actinomadura sp. 7K507]|uniref:TetR/AcrR family transcriptional regulator n=1 Tax=Actinomadura sp. 7K507 TaxID=2530365 RepID=UPI00104A5451|nr:TetR/AcrR family transcriptional regulator [Actinomadura sp. 7K507]TDC96982.1 TetR/AcrR family transcriptional regulator [Actinomadura sp. 7K507]